MKIALVTTTINVPTVLEWYRKCDSDVKFFVAADEKTPLGWALPNNTTFLDIESQKKWKCSEPIGWNSIQRRNIGFLEALKWGAEVIVSIDDDNIPLDSLYFNDFRAVFEGSFSGLAIVDPNTFFDIGQFFIPPSKQRGIPYNHIQAGQISYTKDAKIGVAAGLCLGDPDIDAATRYTGQGRVHLVSEIARAGFAASTRGFPIWNSQNTGVLRELIPAWGMVPFVGRMDDIYASLICGRVMRDRKYWVHYGPPMVWQQRNSHDMIRDMRNEIAGYADVRKLATVLNNMILPNRSIIDDCRTLWRTLSTTEIFPGASIKAMEAYLDDVESVL